MSDPGDLLRQYVESGSEPAFRQLVTRYIDLVYSVALRRAAGDAHRAQDIAQTVFIDLARKAPALPADVMLGGWLHKHCCFVASTVNRTETRRAAREQEAAAMETPHNPEPAWTELAPALDDAIQQLDDEDRQAVILRFFEHKDFRAIGETMGASENAAQKRVARAIEKLRASLGQAGVALSGAALATLLSDNALAAAPAQFLENTLREAIKGSPAIRGAAGKAAAGAGAFAFWKMAALFILSLGVAGLMVAKLTPAAKPKRSSNDPQVDAFAANFAVTNAAATKELITPQATEVVATTNAFTKSLRITVVAADSGQPIPNVPLEFRGMDAGKFVGKTYTTDRVGFYNVPVSATLTELKLTTRVEGFADTLLHFWLNRVEKFPEIYILKLQRGTRIGGKVVGPDGQPVAGAKVHINHEENGGEAIKTESHEFQGLEAMTDAEGAWETSRIPQPLLRRLYGAAEHPEFTRSTLMQTVYTPTVIDELRNATYVFHLGQAATVVGTVVNEKDEPIEGAEILVGERNLAGSRDTRTQADGSFEARGCSLGKSLLTASAKGFAATTIVINTTNAEPHRIVLKYGYVLRLLVTNKRGEPIPNAQIWMETMDVNLNGKIDLKTQASFERVTDAEGRVEWLEAPPGKLLFGVRAANYMLTTGQSAQADGAVHRIALEDGLTISGTVRDAETHELIPNFRVAAGSPGEILHGNTEPIVSWSTADRFWLKFSDGKFAHTFDEYVIYGRVDPKFAFRFEADGYKSEVSRFVRATEGSVKFDIALKKSSDTKVTVLSPEGAPAPDTEVILLPKYGYATIGNSGFTTRLGDAPVIKRTDAKGQFGWNDDPTIIMMVAAGPSGFAQISTKQLGEQKLIRLSRWGRLQGKITQGAKPVTDWRLKFEVVQLPQSIALRLADDVKLNSDGTFKVERVPPVKLQVTRVIESKEDPNMTSYDNLRAVDIQADAVTEFNYTYPAQVAIARLVWPASLPRATDHSVHCGAIISMPGFSKDLLKDRTRHTEWLQRPDVILAYTEHRYASLQETTPGVWVADNLSPGEWTVSATVTKKGGNRNEPEEILLVSNPIKILVKDGPEPMDVGVITLEPAPEMPKP